MCVVKFPALIGVLIELVARCNGALFFPTNSAFGIFAAIAVPLDLPHRQVFVSYNFEANYNYPSTWGIPPILNGIQSRKISADSDCTNCTISDDEETVTTEAVEGTRNETRPKRSLLTRTHFYHIISDKLERTGLNGEQCLLRLICEINYSELGAINGVLGSVIHVMFSPSLSQYEELPLSYYQAEIDGLHDHCRHYEDNCKENILDLISAPVHELFGKF